MTHSQKATLNESSTQQDVNTTTRVDTSLASVLRMKTNIQAFKFIRTIGSLIATQRADAITSPKPSRVYELTGMEDEGFKIKELKERPKLW